MVTAAQLQILQSPIAGLVSTISASVNVKLDDSNYLNWHFQMQLLLESNGIFGFVDGSHPCPLSIADYGTKTPISSSSSDAECDDLLVWKMHDRAIMQLITASLSPVAMSCAIGSISSKDLWVRLKEQFSSVSKTSIFQLKSNLQNIRKGTDTISQYLLKIKEARDYLSAAGLYFVDEDIVILALNGLPAEYNTFRCVVRGRENVITLKDFRSQLLAEESIIENSMINNPTYLAAMNTTSKPHASQFVQSSRGQHSYNTYENGGYRPFNRNRGRGRYNHGQRGFPQRTNLPGKAHVIPLTTPGVLGSLPVPSYNSAAGSNVTVCQLCNAEGHTAPVCGFRGYAQPTCQLCGKVNHTTWFCYYNESGPNFIGNGNASAASALNSNQHHTLYSAQNACSFSQQPTQAVSSVWITDSGATNHMTPDLSNLTLSTPYPATDNVQTANGEGPSNRENTV